MEDQTSRIYTEVYNILHLLGEDYINSLPKSLYGMIKKNIVNSETLKYKSLHEINKDNVLKNSIAMIALFDLNYWCKSEKDKKELKLLLEENYINNETEKRNKYSPDNIFKKKTNNNDNLPIVIKQESTFKKIINFFLKFFRTK